MTESASRLQEALAGRYRVAREIGQGGMAMVVVANWGAVLQARMAGGQAK